MAARNPSPPRLSVEESQVIQSDSIGDTVFSKKWVLQTLMKLVERTRSAETTDEGSERRPESSNGEEEPSPSTAEREGQKVFDNELCELWDMSMNADVAMYLQEVDGTEFLLDLILKSKRPRLTEICVGILGNMACCHEVCVEMMKNNEFIDIITALLDENPDTGILVETTRLIHVCISNKDVVTSWITALKNGSSFKNLIFIVENSLNMELVMNGAHVIDTALDSSDELLQSWADMQLVTAVCEAMKQIRLERILVAEALLHILQLVSTVEQGVQALVSCTAVTPLLCHFIAECGHDEGGIIVGRELSLTASFSVLNVILMAEPIAVLTAMEEDSRIMKILMGLLGYSCKIHRKRTRSSLRFSFSEDEKNGEQEVPAPQTSEDEPNNDKKDKDCSADDDKDNDERNTEDITAEKNNTDDPAVRQTRFSTDTKEQDGQSDSVTLESDVHHQYFTVAIGLLKDIICESSMAPKCVSSMLAPHEKMLEKIVHYSRRISTYRDAIQDLIDSTLSIQELSSLHEALTRDNPTSKHKK